MKNPKPTIRTALSLEIAGVILTAVIDTKTRTVRIEQDGQVVNGEAGAIEAARELLVGRVKRARPDLEVV